MQEINPVHDIYYFDLYLDHRRLSREYRLNYVLVNHYWENSYFIIGNGHFISSFHNRLGWRDFFLKTIVCSICIYSLIFMEYYSI